MDEIVNKAIEGGYKNGHIWGKDGVMYILKDESGHQYGMISEEFIVLDPLFWQALSKACGWGNKRTYNQADQLEVERYWKVYALRFYEINLTEGWDAAVKYLSDLIK